MIKIPALKLASFKSRPAPLLIHPENLKHNSNEFKNYSATLKLNTKSSNSKIINVKKPEFSKCKEIIEWRTKTDFPIVKVKNWKLLSEKMHDLETELELMIELQGSFKLLQDFEKISFIQAIYILKESLIGFERLCYHFGSFHVDSSMIKFNESGICKVWINKDCYSNEINAREVQSQKDFIFQLCQAMKGRISKSGRAKIFFENIQSCQYFFEAIGAIESFTRQHIINVPSTFQYLEDCKSPLLKMSVNLFPNQQKQNSAIQSQIPPFLKRNQVKKKNSNETSTPSPNKKLEVKKTGFFDRSLTDVNRKFSSFMVLKKQSRQQQNLQEQVYQKKGVLKNGMNQFSEGLNIRLIQPSQQKDLNAFSCQNLSKWNPKHEINPESRKNLFGQVSDIGSSEGHKSQLSLHQCKNHENKSLKESNANIVVKVTQPKRLNGSLLPNQPASPFKQRLSKEIGFKGQANEDFEQKEDDMRKLSPNTKQLREKRKYSVNIDSFSGQIEERTEGNQKNKPPSFLSSLKNQKNKISLNKSPSHQIISPCLEFLQLDRYDRNNIFLRQTFMVGSNWNIDEKKISEKKIIYPLQDTKQTLRWEKAKPQAKKLALLGRQVNQSSDTEEAEFQLEYGIKMKNGKSIRNDILNVLN